MAEWETGPRLPDDPGRYIPIATRRTVYLRDKGLCRYCEETATDFDHIYPFANGGTHHETNLVACCGVCNSIAGSRVFSEFAKKRLYVLRRRIDLARGATHAQPRNP